MPDTKYLRAVYAAAREHKVDSEGLHETALARFNKSSLKDLTNEEACELMNGIRGIQRKTYGKKQAMGTHGRRDNPPQPGDPIYQVTQGELHEMRVLAFRRGMTDATLGAFCQRLIKQDEPRTQSEFNKVFWGLKSMQRRDDEKYRKALQR